MKVLEELEECVSGAESAESEAEQRELLSAIHDFLSALPPHKRGMFLCRYWYADPVQDIADTFGFSAAKVNSMLYRTRQKLRRALAKEGY